MTRRPVEPADPRPPAPAAGPPPRTDPATSGRLTVRFFAAARAAAGVESVRHPAMPLPALVSLLGRRHGEGLRRVLSMSSFLVDGGAWHDRDACLPDDCTVDVLPPFAGG